MNGVDFLKSKKLSQTQIGLVLKYSQDFLLQLDDIALKELFSGSKNDVNNIYLSILDSTQQILFGIVKFPLHQSSFNYLEKITDSLDIFLRRKSFNYFVLTSLPSFEMDLHHVCWGNLIQFYLRLLVIAARDHSKSVTFSFAYPIWKMFRYLKNPVGDIVLTREENNRNKKGMLITNEFSLAKEFLKYIRDEIETNPFLYNYLYPDSKNIDWGNSSITCKNGAELTIKGSSSALRGRHPDWIVFDDLLDESSLYSKDARDKTKNFFHSVIENLIVPGGQLIGVGTPMHKDDLYGELKKNSEWKVFEFPAIFPNGEILWESRYDLKQILQKKQDQGSIIFSREILVNPISDDSTIFPYEILSKAFRGMEEFTLVNNIHSFPKKFDKVSVGLDFAVSANIGSDYTVYTVWGLDEYKNYWLIGFYRERGMGYNKQIAVLKDLVANFSPDVIMAEDNVFQKVIVDIAIDAGINVIGHTTGVNKYDLRTGLPALSVLFEQGRIRFPRGDNYSKDVTDTICLEASGVTWTEKGLGNTTEHDDTVMSSWLGIKGINYVNSTFTYNFF